ncbi:MAG: hypothetical protein ABR956_10955 [Terracidiphilus sp.]|jgi:hypothetical protein
MTYLAFMLFDGPDPVGMGLWAFLSIGAVALFCIFLPITTWLGTRQKEREAFYQAETLRRVAEASSEGSKAALDLLREQERQKRVKSREGMKIGGLVNIGVGLALIIFLRSLGGGDSPYLCGLIPGFIGVALLIYAYFLAAPLE